jgi:RecB family exonuclease
MTTTTRINNFSASQINAFNNCQRLWFLQSILRIRFPESGARKRGKEIHDILEHYLKTGVIKKDHVLEFYRYIEWLVAAEALPDPKEEHLAIEQEIWLDSHNGLPLLDPNIAPIGIPIKGFIDLGLWGRIIPSIEDLKTTSNMRYAKTPAELNQDTQMNMYARWVLGVQKDLDEVQVGHIYVKVESANKKPPKKTRSKKVLPVYTTITRAGNEAVWQRDAATMEEMKIVSLTERWEDVEPNLNHCPSYGGCDFREKCGITAKTTLFQPPTKGQDMSFLDKIKNAEKNNAGPPAGVMVKEEVKAAPVEVAAAPAKKESSFLAGLKKPPIELAAKVEVKAEPTTILPPDAAPRTPSDEESEAIRNEAQEKLDAKEEKKAAAAEKKAAAAEKKAAKPVTRKGKHKRELTLYIGCSPTKGEDQGFVMMEDWIAPIIEALNATVLESTQKQDYRLLGYAEEKIALTQAVTSAVRNGELPRALVCMASGVGREVATILIPLATDVVSANK